MSFVPSVLSLQKNIRRDPSTSPGHWYIVPITSAYLDATKNLFSIKVGPNSPPLLENSAGNTANFCTFDGFDSAIFWSAGMLHKHFKTCGVEKWDIEFRDLVPHYRLVGE